MLGEVLLPSDDVFLRRYPHQLSGGQQQRVGARHGIRLPAPCDRAGRTDDRARRDDPGPRARDRARPLRSARRRRGLREPRPGRGRNARRSRRGHVRGTPRRARPDGERCSGKQPIPTHAGSSRRSPRCPDCTRSSASRAPRRDPDTGRTAASSHRAARTSRRHARSPSRRSSRCPTITRCAASAMPPSSATPPQPGSQRRRDPRSGWKTRSSRSSA